MGERWRTTGLLVLGESHYHYPGEDPEDVEKTISTVQKVIDGQAIRFFTTVERAITGRRLGETRPADFLPTISFANFCQGAADGASGAKTPDMWNRGITAFPLILEDLHPNRMLVFSTESWKRFTRLEGPTWRHERAITIGAYSEDTGFLENSDGSVKVYCMNVGHPSGRGWGSPEDWNRFIMEFLKHPI